MTSCTRRPPGITFRFRGPDHHLWLRGRVYWITYQHPSEDPAHKARQRRLSLRTRDLHEARARRDALLAACLGAQPRRLAA